MAKQEFEALGNQCKETPGRRVFIPSKEEIRAAQTALGIAAPIIAIGQQGHDGQQILVKEVEPRLMEL